MFKKFGDPNPITIIDPIDVDNESTKKSLKKTIKNVKDSQEKKQIIPTPIKKESETK
jgi:hypothetical protein